MTTITRNVFALRYLAAPCTTVDTARVDRDILAAIACLFGVWAQRHTTRAHLRRLDVHLLADIGLSVTDAEREAGKPFWRA
ncbi:MAG: DUF1127 domain-containing protein [Gammaproteobacteria bacterium]|nr:DUF1127 domain-containing protein [Gammaproteobacteria bacterium]MDH3466944.1 DUF1127 domain-containing protein [Gammaproteobacteria bacterium]